jgi:cytochrome c peroxidase
MDEHIPNVITKLQQNALYKSLFKKAFGSEEINTAKMLKALSQFMLHCVSANSRYDQYVRKEGVQLTADELEGMALFQQKCASCHSTDLFTDQLFHNNGLPPSLVNDKGRALITLNNGDLYKFKTPSLRNVANTAPYMHDGRFRTLMAVLDHYTNGVQDSPTLDPRLRNGNTTGIPLTVNEKNKLVAFMNTLTDETFLRDPKLAEQ